VDDTIDSKDIAKTVATDTVTITDNTITIVLDTGESRVLAEYMVNTRTLN